MIATPDGPTEGDDTSRADELRTTLDGVLSAPDDSDRAHVVVATSGSTGQARRVRISARALRASGEATAARLGGHGQWLLALPTDHVAGLQVVARSVLAGTRPVEVPLVGGFRSAAFGAAAARLTASRTYTSLVPTQLHRLLEAADAGDGRGLEAARSFDAVLVGGAASSPSLLAAARAAGVAVVTTYGMSETAGGCVYDGSPLDGVTVRVRAGRIEISGPVLADGYDGDEAATREAFVEPADGASAARWFRTSDLGELTAAPHGSTLLRVLGRADDVLVTGGVNVSPAAVEALLAGWGPVREACVVGIPDEVWGTRLVAVLVLGHRTNDDALLRQVRARVTDTLGSPAAPREIVIVDALPVRGPGKVDRRAAAGLAARRLTAPGTNPPGADAER